MTQRVADIGEFGLIERLDRIICAEGGKAAGLTLGIGDDCASFRPRPGFEVLLTCDALVEGRHYLPRHISPRDLGRRAMTLNISDIGAMGGRPLYAMVSLGLRPDLEVTYIEELYRGFLAELTPLGAAIVGGNLTKVEGPLFMDITLVGEVEPDRMLRRATARPGDVILLTGQPGRSAAGLGLLLKEPESPALAGHPLRAAFNTPTHRAREGRAVALAGAAHAMIDTSDGFLGDLGHICTESRVGADLYQARLPVSTELAAAARQLACDPLDLVLKDSDDYELVITCSAADVPAVRAAVASVSPVPLSEVGIITPEAGMIRLIAPHGAARALKAAGWDHFSPAR